jgi:hypothetical protein
MKNTSTPANAGEQKFDRGTGTGEPTAEIARLLNLMKQVDDAFNAREYNRFLDQLHSEDVKVIQFDSDSTFTKPMQTPEGGTIAPTGKRFETFFTTIAKWKNDRIIEEYVMLDPRDIMKQVVP